MCVFLPSLSRIDLKEKKLFRFVIFAVICRQAPHSSSMRKQTWGRGFGMWMSSISQRKREKMCFYMTTDEQTPENPGRVLNYGFVVVIFSWSRPLKNYNASCWMSVETERIWNVRARKGSWKKIQEEELTLKATLVQSKWWNKYCEVLIPLHMALTNPHAHYAWKWQEISQSGRL